MPEIVKPQSKLIEDVKKVLKYHANGVYLKTIGWDLLEKGYTMLYNSNRKNREIIESQSALFEDMRKVLKDHARHVYSRTERALTEQGYTLVDYIDGEITLKRFKDLRDEFVKKGRIVSKNIELMESGATIPDLVIKNENGEYVVLIEATITSTIEVRAGGRGLIEELVKFAQTWEEERVDLKKKVKLPDGYNIAEVVKIIET